MLSLDNSDTLFEDLSPGSVPAVSGHGSSPQEPDILDIITQEQRPNKPPTSTESVARPPGEISSIPSDDDQKPQSPASKQVLPCGVYMPYAPAKIAALNRWKTRFVAWKSRKPLKMTTIPDAYAAFALAGKSEYRPRETLPR